MNVLCIYANLFRWIELNSKHFYFQISLFCLRFFVVFVRRERPRANEWRRNCARCSEANVQRSLLRNSHASNIDIECRENMNSALHISFVSFDEEISSFEKYDTFFCYGHKYLCWQINKHTSPLRCVSHLPAAAMNWWNETKNTAVSIDWPLIAVDGGGKLKSTKSIRME